MSPPAICHASYICVVRHASYGLTKAREMVTQHSDMLSMQNGNGKHYFEH